MREKIWLWWESTKHSMLYNYSLKYRQALRLIDIQEHKLNSVMKVREIDRKMSKQLEELQALESKLIIKLLEEKAELEEELSVLKSISPFKGPKQFLADAINKGETNE